MNKKSKKAIVKGKKVAFSMFNENLKEDGVERYGLFTEHDGKWKKS